MAGPGDEIAAGGGRGHLRASHADREQVIGTLKAAFVQGMLAKDEFDLRVGQAFAARTYADLAAVTADLPAGLAAAQPLTPVRAPGEQRVLRPGPVIAAATALYAGVWVYVPLSPKGGDNRVAFALVFLGAVFYLMILVICVGHMLASRHEERSGGQLPRRPAPGAGDQASRRQPPADPGGSFLRPITATSTPPKQREGVPPAALAGSRALRR
jgi:Domain of unknown function (DUF1707)